MATYCFEYKKKIVTEYLQGKGSYKELASKYSIDFTNIRHWEQLLVISNCSTNWNLQNHYQSSDSDENTSNQRFICKLFV